jgi:hypothetical protein
MQALEIVSLTPDSSYDLYGDNLVDLEDRKAWAEDLTRGPGSAMLTWTLNSTAAIWWWPGQEDVTKGTVTGLGRQFRSRSTRPRSQAAGCR